MNCNLTMYDFIVMLNRNNKDCDKVYFNNNKLTFNELVSDIDKFASFLALKLHIKKGDCVAICLPNIPHAAVALYAVTKLGAIANVIHPKMKARALSKIIEDTNSKLLITYDSFVGEYQELIKKNGIQIISCSAGDYLKGIKRLVLKLISKKVVGMINYADIMKFDKSYSPENLDGSLPSVYLHSSGTTGKSKTVVLTSFAFNSLVYNTVTSLNEDHIHDINETQLMILPLFHGFGLGVSLHLSIAFMKVVLMPAFKPGEAIKLIEKHKISMLTGTPAMFRKMVKDKNAKGNKLATVKDVYCGGDKLSHELKKAFDEMLKSNGSIAEICEGYGLSEVASVATLSINGQTKLDSQGKPIDSVILKVLDDNNNEVKPNVSGSLVMRSDSIMIGYLGEDVEHDNEHYYIDDEGVKWLITGDEAYLDEEGYLYFRGRNKRSIKIGGVNIFPAEVEELVQEMPEIESACAVRIKYEGKPALKLVVVMNKNFRMSYIIEQKIKSRIESEILKYAVPKEIEVVDSIPRNALGKVNYLVFEKDGGKI